MRRRVVDALGSLVIILSVRAIADRPSLGPPSRDRKESIELWPK